MNEAPPESGSIDPAPAEPERVALARAKASVLVEALPWLRRFSGEIVVVKFGGSTLSDNEHLASFAEDVVFLRTVGIQPVVVHGGGPQITAMLDRLGIPAEFRGGYRVTTPAAMAVVRMVLSGQVNREIVSKLNALGDLAIGLSGEDAGLFRAEVRGTAADGSAVDLGLVGDITEVSPHAVFTQLGAGRIPVVSSIALDVATPGQALNVNADAAAAALAVSLGAAKLVVLTDVPGLYRDWPNRDSLISRLTLAELHELLPRLESGMVPKMEACRQAVAGGVATAAVVDGRLPHSLLLEIFTSAGVGTEVVAR